MALATQCPHCYTSFRVANDQLKLHAGMVRCGSCKQTFNGIEHLLPPGATPKTAPPAPEPDILASTSTQASNTSLDTEVNVANAVVSETIEQTQLQITEPTPSPDIPDNDISDNDIPDNDISLVDSFGDDVKSSETKQTLTLAQLIDAPESESEFEFETDKGNFDATQKVVFNPDVSDSTTTELVTASENAPSRFEILEPAAPENSERRKDSAESPADNQSEATSEIEVIADTVQTTPAATPTNDTSLKVVKVQPKNDDASAPTSASSSAEKRHQSKPGALTASLDFELSKEDREWVDEIAHVHQLELETRAALLNEETDDWSKHEPILPQDDVIDSLDDLKPILDDIGDFTDASPRASKKIEHSNQAQANLTTSDSNAESPLDEINSVDVVAEAKGDHDTPAFVLQAERDQRFGKWKRVGLSLGLFFFATLALAQSVYFFRSDLAAHLPQFKPQLISLCKTLSCQIKLPAQKSMLEITGSELLIISEELGINTLSIQIQNKSGTVQAWPYVELTLKDRRGKDLLQKAFTPAQYLDNKELLAKGMPASSETNHKIFFQLDGLKASDYATEIFYP
jgi:predicted Zn finger-like uncharacterized protein